LDAKGKTKEEPKMVDIKKTYRPLVIGAAVVILTPLLAGIVPEIVALPLVGNLGAVITAAISVTVGSIVADKLKLR